MQLVMGSMQVYPEAKALCDELFHVLHLRNKLDDHLEMRKQLGMDVIFLPMANRHCSNREEDYRYFSLDEVQEARERSTLFLTAVIDGPIQKIAKEEGLSQVLHECGENSRRFGEKIEAEGRDVLTLVKKCVRLGVDAVVIADDLGWDRCTYFRPNEINRFLGAFYAQANDEIHLAGSYGLFHSCGNIAAILQDLISFGFDGFAACQGECMDLISLKETYGSKVLLLAGIDAHLLQAKVLTNTQKENFTSLVKCLAKGGGFVLCSSCGIYSSNFINRLQELYRVAEDCLFACENSNDTR